MMDGMVTPHEMPVAAKWPARCPSLFEADPVNMGINSMPNNLLYDFDIEWRFQGATGGGNRIIYVTASGKVILVAVGHNIRIAENISIATENMEIEYTGGRGLNLTLDDPKDWKVGPSPIFVIPDSAAPDEAKGSEASIQRIIDEALAPPTIVEATRPKEQAIEENLERIFDEARDEEFENGMDSKFSESLTAMVLLHDAEAVIAVGRILKTPNIGIEVLIEALRQIGQLEHEPTRAARLNLIEPYLRNDAIRVRYAACLGLAALEDAEATGTLRAALDAEPSEQIRKILLQVINQLEII